LDWIESVTGNKINAGKVVPLGSHEHWSGTLSREEMESGAGKSVVSI
jgi:hypothetical protein